jgi:hypothetical protein
VPRTQTWAVVPELAVEVISPNNTFEEVVSKVHEYFQAGVQQAWVVAPPQQQVYVYLFPSRIRVLNVQDELTGDPFLPGFRLKLSGLFDVEATEAGGQRVPKQSASTTAPSHVSWASQSTTCSSKGCAVS